MQPNASQVAPTTPWIQAAGAVTIVFGVLAALLGAASIITAAVAGAAEETLPVTRTATLLLAGTGFVLLGWGVLRHTRLCAVSAAGIAGLLLAFQVLQMHLEGTSGSVFLLLLSGIVLLVNAMACKDIRHPTPAETDE